MSKFNPVYLRNAMTDIINPDESKTVFKKLKSMISPPHLTFALKTVELVNPSYNNDDIIEAYHYKLSETSMSAVQGLTEDDSKNLIVLRTKNDIVYFSDLLRYPNLLGNDLWVIAFEDDFFTRDMILNDMMKEMYAEVERIVEYYAGMDINMDVDTTLSEYYQVLPMYIVLSAFSKHYNLSYNSALNVYSSACDFHLDFSESMFKNIRDYSLSPEEDMLNVGAIVALFASLPEVDIDD